MASSRIVSCDHVGVFSNDPARLVQFYCEKLGFVLEKEEVLPPSIVRPVFGLTGSCRLVKLTAAEAGKDGRFLSLKVEIFQPLDVKIPRRRNGIVGFNHCSFRTGDRLRFLRDLRSKGVKPIVVRRNGRSVFFIRDPDGNRIEIRD